MEKQVVEIFSKTEETDNSQIKGEQNLIELNKTATLLFEKFDKYKWEKVEKNKIMKEIQKEIKSISATIKEQNSRRNCLLIYGLPEKRNESTDQIVNEDLKEKVQDEIKVVDLDVTPRLGAPKGGKIKPIIVKSER